LIKKVIYSGIFNNKPFLMLSFAIRIVVTLFLISFLDIFNETALAEGRMYEGTAEGPCIEWSNKRLKLKRKRLKNSIV
jgi:hypothetical protein